MSAEATRPARSTHGAILGVDMQEFTHPDRNDSDRVWLRDRLHRIVREVVGTVADPVRCRYSDIGDGLLVVFPPEVQKSELIVRLIPRFEQLLLEHNRVSSAHIRLRVRVALELGEVLLDEHPLTGRGLVGNGLNAAARLLDCDLLRTTLQRAPDRRPLALLVSEDFYNQIIREQLAIFQSDYQRCNVYAKDRTLVAWLWPAGQASDAAWRSDRAPLPTHGAVRVRQPLESARPRLTLADLPRTCVYVPTSDVHTHALYGMLAGRVPMANHLETALLLGRHAIVHCSDPYRSVEVCELLESFQQLTEDGSLLFLLGSSIQDVRQDFLAYLHRKALQYVASLHGLADIASLSRPAEQENSAFDERVVDLIDSSPVMLYRGFKGTAAFVEAVRDDLRRAEPIVAYSHDPASLRRRNPTLFQLLHLERVTPEGRVLRVLATDDTIDRLRDQLESRLYRSSFSRQILLSLIQEQLGDALPSESVYYGLLAARITLLHLRINVGMHAFIECTPGRDEDSPYYYEHLLRHVAILGGAASRERFGVPLVARLRLLPCWPAFVNHHLRIISDLHVRRLGGLPVSYDERDEHFAASSRCVEFEPIIAAVQDLWR